MQALAPEVRANVERAFRDATFVADVGIGFLDCGPGWCECSLTLLPRHMQHTGIAHAGVQATLADHAAGGAAFTVVPEGHHVLTAEFKINLLRPAQGELLWCRATVLKPGRAIIVVESEVYAEQAGKRSLTAKLNATLAVVPIKGLS